MDRLWAPWRAKYVTGLSKKNKGCIFCKITKEKNDRKNYIVLRTEYSFAVLNIFPYNNGHILIVPYRHAGVLSKFTNKEKKDLWMLLELTQKLLDRVLKPRGYNIGINIGKISGAGFPGHLHIHLVPRWSGDVNFMPVITGTKVVSQSLRMLFTKLKDAYKKRY